MTVDKKTERVRDAVYQALMPLLKRFWGDEEAFRQLGPILMSGAVYLMINDLGADFAVAAMRDMADRVEQGDFSSPFSGGDESLH